MRSVECLFRKTGRLIPLPILVPAHPEIAVSQVFNLLSILLSPKKRDPSCVHEGIHLSRVVPETTTALESW